MFSLNHISSANLYTILSHPPESTSRFTIKCLQQKDFSDTWTLGEIAGLAINGILSGSLALWHAARFGGAVCSHHLLGRFEAPTQWNSVHYYFTVAKVSILMLFCLKREAWQALHHDYLQATNALDSIIALPLETKMQILSKLEWEDLQKIRLVSRDFAYGELQQDTLALCFEDMQKPVNLNNKLKFQTKKGSLSKSKLIAQLKQCGERVKDLDLIGLKLSTEELKSILDICPHIQCLKLGTQDEYCWIKIEEGHFASIASLKNLKQLHFIGCDIKENVLKGIEKCTSLEELTLKKTPTFLYYSREILNSLAQLTKLIVLDLEGSTIDSNLDLEFFRRSFEHLVRLNLPHCASFVAADMTGTSPTNSKMLTSLSISYNSKIEDAVFDSLQSLPLTHLKIASGWSDSVCSLATITHLELSDSSLSDDKMSLIGNMNQLTYLKLRSKEITDAGIESIQDLNLTSLNLSNCNRVTGLALSYIKKFKNLAYLNMDACFQVDSEGLEEIRDLKLLTHLILSHTRIDNKSLKVIKKFKNLSYLNIDNTHCSEKGIKYLKKLVYLREISLDFIFDLEDLEGDKITEKGLKHLAGLPRLRSLSIADANVSEEGWGIFKEFKSLTHLNCTSCGKISSISLQQLAKVPRLTHLDLRSCESIQDDMVSSFAHFPRLNYLSLSWTKITQNSLPHLQSLKSLAFLDLYSCHLLDSSMIKQYFPDSSGIIVQYYDNE